MYDAQVYNIIIVYYVPVYVRKRRLTHGAAPHYRCKRRRHWIGGTRWRVNASVRPSVRPSSSGIRATRGRPPAPNGRAPVGQSAQAPSKYNIKCVCLFVCVWFYSGQSSSCDTRRWCGGDDVYRCTLHIAHCTYYYYMRHALWWQVHTYNIILYYTRFYGEAEFSIYLRAFIKYLRITYASHT